MSWALRNEQELIEHPIRGVWPKQLAYYTVVPYYAQGIGLQNPSGYLMPQAIVSIMHTDTQMWVNSHYYSDSGHTLSSL